MKKPESIDGLSPLSRVNQKVFNKIKHRLEKDEEQRQYFSSDEEYQKAVIWISNNIYLMYELLYLKVIREIDYYDIKNFAVKNNDLVKYVLKQELPEFSIEGLDNWTHVRMDLLPCSMYSRNNSHNKHIYH